MKFTEIPIVIGALRTIPNGLLETGGLKSPRTKGAHPDYSICKICQNTEKSHGDL